MGKLLSALIGIVGALWLGIAGAGAMWWWDRRPHGEPAVHFRLLFWPITLAAPDSIQVSAYAKGATDQRQNDMRAFLTAVHTEAAVATQIDHQDQAAQARIQVVTRTQIKEVPVYVTPEADRGCRVPRGFVGLHDAAAAGRAPGLDPDPAAPAGDAAQPGATAVDTDSGLRLSDIAATVIRNYGTCLSIRRTLVDLQQLDRERDAIAAEAVKAGAPRP